MNIMFIKSSYFNFDVLTISSYVKNLIHKDFVECTDGFELYDCINNYLKKLSVTIEPTVYFKGTWSNLYVSEAITYSNGKIIIYSLEANELYDLWESKYERIDIVREWVNTIVHEFTHKYQMDKYENRISTGQGENEYEYLTNKDEISAHVHAGVIELLNLGYTEKQIVNKISNFDDFCDLCSESNQLYPYLSYIEDNNDELYKIIVKEMYSILKNFF